MTDPIITLTEISKHFPDSTSARVNSPLGRRQVGPTIKDPNARQDALKNISITVKTGEFLCIWGPTAAGKSTLAGILQGNIIPTTGSASIQGQPIGHPASSHSRRRQAQLIGSVFQSPALLNQRSVRDNVAYPLEIAGFTKGTRWQHAHAALAQVGRLRDADLMPNGLDCAAQHQIAFARALVTDPTILLIDDSLAGCDISQRHLLQQQLRAVARTLNKTAIYLLTDLQEALSLGDRVAILNAGHLHQIDSPERIFSAPADEFVHDLTRYISKIDFVTAQAIMDPIDDRAPPLHLRSAPRLDQHQPLAQLIDVAVGSPLPVVITGAQGAPIGFVTKERLLRSIKGDLR